MGKRTRATARRLVGAVVLVGLLPLSPAGARPPDVPRRHWARDAIEFVVAEGLLGLDGQGRFRPDDPVGRAVALRGIWLGNGAPEGYPPHGLTGVGARFDPAVRWAVAEGIDRGFADGTFQASAPVSRGQYLRWLWRPTVRRSRTSALTGSSGPTRPRGWPEPRGRPPTGRWPRA